MLLPLRKICSVCGNEKAASLHNFFAHPSCSLGLDSACRSCRNAQRRDWKHRNKERLSAKRRQDYAVRYGERQRVLEAARKERFPFRTTAERMAGGLRERAKERGLCLAPELRTKAFIEEWLRRQTECECCGIAFSFGPTGTGKKNDCSPSFDRFDLRIGYTLDNTALVCWRCNNIKRNYDAADLRKVADWIDRRRATGALPTLVEAVPATWGNERAKFDMPAEAAE